MVVGGGDDRDLDRLHSLEAMLEGRRPRVRYYDYERAEAAVETLAARLLEAFPRDELERHAFVPIPRGGLIVLGMLSYLLDLSPDQVPPAPIEGRPVFLVDDLALTGARIRAALDDLDLHDVVVAHLGSHPELRSAVEADPRARSCVAAFDLQADEGSTSGDRWEERLGERYWLGRPELVAFAWSEPDQILWDETKVATESGWRMVTPERALKNRALLGPPALDREARSLRFPGDIAFGLFDDGYLICRLETEEVHRLDAVAGAIWGALGTLGDVDAAARHLTTVFDTDEAALARDTEAMRSRLLDAGLLEPTSPTG